MAHLVGGAKAKRNIWETTEVYGVALSGKEGTTQEYLWEEQILAALYLADRTQPPIQYPQPHEQFIEIMEDIGDTNAERRDEASHRRTGLGAPHSMRKVRNEGGRQMYVVNSHSHWRLVMIDSTKKQVWAFDPMGNTLSEREEDVITRAFPEHAFRNLGVRVQGREDHVNCGIWVIWAGRIWLSQEAKASDDLQQTVQATMRRQNLTNLIGGDERGGGPTNKRFANDVRVALRLELNPNGALADPNIHAYLREHRKLTRYYIDPPRTSLGTQSERNTKKQIRGATTHKAEQRAFETGDRTITGSAGAGPSGVKNKNDTKQHKRPRNPEGTHKDEGKREGGTEGETTTRQTKRRQATQTPLPQNDKGPTAHRKAVARSGDDTREGNLAAQSPPTTDAAEGIALPHVKLAGIKVGRPKGKRGLLKAAKDIPMNKIDSTFEKAEPITLEKPFLQRTPPCATNAREYQRFEASDRLLDQLNKDREAKRERTREEVRKEGARKAEAQQEVAWRGRGTNATEGRQGWDREDRVTLMTWNCRGIKHTLSTVGETHTLKEMTNQLRPKVVFMQETKLRHRYRKPKLEQMQDFTDYYNSLPANRTRGGKKIDLPAYQTHNKAGVVTLIHNSLCPTQNVERMGEPRNLQGYMVGLKLHTSRGSLLLINLYIPPKGNAAADQGDTPEYGRDAVLEGVLEWTKAHRKRGEPILLGGDMNAAWAPQDRPVTRKLTNVDKEYREWTKKLGILPIDCYSQVEHPNEMRGLTYESGATDPSSGHMGSRSRIDDWLASLEGSPSLQREDFDRDGQPNYCTAHRNLAHLSDHHPLIAHLHGTNMGIRVNKDWAKDTQTNRVHTKRLKKYMTDDERKSVKDVLEETLKGGIADVTSRIRCIGETGLDVRE